MPVALSRLLVAIDGSEQSDYALNVALKIGERFGSKIVLIHVHTPTGGVAPIIDPVIGSTNVIIPPQSDSEVKVEEARAGHLLADRMQVVLARNLECKAISKDSPDVAGEILRAAESGKYEILILGSRGRSGLKSLFLGSVSTKVAKEAKCSVLVIRKRIEGAPKILLGYDGSEESKKALDFVASLGSKLGGQVDPLAVVNVPPAPEGLVGTDIEKWESEMRRTVEEAVAALTSGGLKCKGKVADYVDVARALCDEGEKGSYNLIAVGSRGKRGRLESIFLGSVASGVANNAKTNVLIVR